MRAGLCAHVSGRWVGLWKLSVRVRRDLGVES